MTEKWIIDEVQYAGPEHLDAAYVSGYDRKAQVDPTPDLQALIDLGLSQNSRVIDFGAGSGTFALAIAPYCQEVIAIDPSPAMNAYLRAAVAAAQVSNLTVVNSGFLSYEHRGEPVDFIFTRNALHHLPDFWKTLALSRLRTLLAPHGILRIKDLFYDFAPEESAAKLADWVAGAVDDPAKGWTAAELAEHVRTEYSTFSWLFELMLHQTGFEIIERSYQRAIYGTYTCRLRA